jgi:hypothetical protein
MRLIEQGCQEPLTHEFDKLEARHYPTELSHIHRAAYLPLLAAMIP